MIDLFEIPISSGIGRIPVSKTKLTAICRRNNIAGLALYGSVLREDFRPESDVDILVEFEQGKTPGFLKMAEIENELSGLFGRKVDLRTPLELSPYFREKVKSQARILCP
jgi:predicted nucleotidyltransferase